MRTQEGLKSELDRWRALRSLLAVLEILQDCNAETAISGSSDTEIPPYRHCIAQRLC